MKQRRTFDSMLKSSCTGLNSSRYFRLMGLASSEWLVSLPLSIYALIVNAESMFPWISWDYVHADFSRVCPFFLRLSNGY